MIQIIDGRATGKTSRLLLLAKEQNLTIAARNPYDLREKAHNYGITGLEIIDYNDLLFRGHHNEQGILIDELEGFAKWVLQKNYYHLLGYTLSKEDK